MAHPQLTQVPRQTVPHRPHEVPHLETQMTAQHEIVAKLATAAATLALGTLRFEHLRRSTMFQCLEHIIDLSCSRVKNPHLLEAISFLWFVPRKGVSRSLTLPPN